MLVFLTSVTPRDEDGLCLGLRALPSHGREAGRGASGRLRALSQFLTEMNIRHSFAGEKSKAQDRHGFGRRAIVTALFPPE